MISVFKKKESPETQASAEKENEPSPRLRVRLLDTLRGVAVIYMIAFHTFYDLYYMFDVPWAKAVLDILDYALLAAGIIFVFLGGVTIRFAANPAKHGARALVLAGIFTAVTAFMMPGQAIYFGVLHFFAVAMLVYSVIGKVMDKIPVWITVPVLLALYVFTMNTKEGYFGLEGLFTVELPSILYYNNNLYPFGIIGRGFASSDYYPIFPWIFLFLVGTIFGRLFIDKDGDQKVLPKWVYRRYLPVTSFIGKNSLLIYVLHQPIIYLILIILDYYSII